MKAFRFNLEKVLEWRAIQLRTAEEKLTQLQHSLSLVSQQEQELLTDYRGHEEKLISSPVLEGSDLHALASFRERTIRLIQALQAQKAQWEALIVEQRQHLLKARSNHRILEKLKERRLRDWMYLHDREIENTAAEVHLANWVRMESEKSTRH